MSGHKFWFATWTLLAATLAIAGFTGCKGEDNKPIPPEPDSVGAYAALDNLSPKSGELAECRREGKLVHYATAAQLAGDPTLIDVSASGFAGEVPLMQEYGYRMSVVQQYAKRRTTDKAIITIHEMESGDDAYGLFGLMAQEGEPVSGPWLVGRRAGDTIAFVKSRYIVVAKQQIGPVDPKKKPDPVDPNAGPPVELVVAAANATAAKILSSGLQPALIQKLPADGLVAGSQYFVRGPLGLKNVPGAAFIQSDAFRDRVLGSAKVTIVVAAYSAAGANKETIFVVEFPSTDEAQLAGTNLDAVLQSGTATDRNSVTYTVDRSYLVGTLNAEEESIQRVIPKVVTALAR